VERDEFESIRDRLEYLHTEAKSFRSEALNLMHTMDKRLSRQEFLGERTEERLNAGSSTMAKLNEQIERVNAKIDTPWYKVVGFILPAVFAVVSVVWQMARNPSGAEFEELKRQVWQVQGQNDKIDTKLDMMLQGQKQGPQQP
jgi:hypothetical protein